MVILRKDNFVSSLLLFCCLNICNSLKFMIYILLEVRVLFVFKIQAHVYSVYIIVADILIISLHIRSGRTRKDSRTIRQTAIAATSHGRINKMPRYMTTV